MTAEPRAFDRIKPFIRMLEGSIEQARNQRLQREKQQTGTLNNNVPAQDIVKKDGSAPIPLPPASLRTTIWNNNPSV